MKRNKIISTLLVAGVLASYSVISTPSIVHAATEDKPATTATEEGNDKADKDADANTADATGEADKETTEKEATTGTLNVTTYYVPLDLKYNSPMFFDLTKDAWTTSGDKVALDNVTHKLQHYNEAKKAWEDIEFSNDLEPGKYKIIAGDNHFKALYESREFIIEKGLTTNVDLPYENFEVPTSFTVAASEEGVEVEGLTYEITADDETLGTTVLRKGTVVDGKISTTLENGGRYKISFSNGEQKSNPVKFIAAPDQSGTYVNTVKIYKFGTTPSTTEETTNQAATETQSGTVAQDTSGKGYVGKGGAPQTSVMGVSAGPLLATSLAMIAGGTIAYRKRVSK